METNQFFEIFNHFEKEIICSPHALVTKIHDSKSFPKIIRQKKMVIMDISEFLSTKSKTVNQRGLFAEELKEAWIFVLSSFATINGINNLPAYKDDFKIWKDWACRQKFLEIKTTLRTPDIIIVNISDEACLPFGFKHGDIATSPHHDEVEISGVAEGNDGIPVLWYIILHPAIKGRICYWEGPKNLLEAGFVKKKISVIF